MKNSSEIKRAALDALTNNWGSAIGCSAAAMGISYAVSFVLCIIVNISIVLSGLGAVFNYAKYYNRYDLEMLWYPGAAAIIATIGVYLVCSVASSVILSNIYIGQYKFHLNLTNGRRASVTDIFCTLRTNFWKAFGLYLVMQLKAALWMFVFYIPGVTLFSMGTVMTSVSGSPTGAVLLALGLILIIASIIPYYMAVMRYAVAPMIYLEDMSIGVFGAIRRSKELMKGHKSDLFILYLSFIGWYLLACLTCGIGFLFLSPYILCSVCVFYNELLGRPTADNSMRYVPPTSVFGTYNGQNICNPDFVQNTPDSDGYTPEESEGSSDAQNGHSPDDGQKAEKDDSSPSSF